MDSAWIAGLAAGGMGMVLAFFAGKRSAQGPAARPPAVLESRARNERKTPELSGAPATLLRAIVDAAPMAVIVFGETGRVWFSNQEARQLFAKGDALEGENFLRLADKAPEPLRQSLVRPLDALFSIDGAEGLETFSLARRELDLEGETLTLLTLKELTPELERQEVDVWKRVLRVINHELNNSLAPILSMAQTARMIVREPAQLPKLELAFATIEDRTRHLSAFLDGYARFARLPRPRRERVRWAAFLDGLRALYPEVRIGEAPPGEGYFDPGQLQQVVINLLKNAIEASGGAASVELRVELGPNDEATLTVSDRGSGMSDETLKHALLPFFSTKEHGTGLGLALSREIIDAHHGKLALARRAGGGVEVSCWLPGVSRAPLPRTATLTLTRS